MIVAFEGLMTVGKTRLSRLLAQRKNATVLSEIHPALEALIKHSEHIGTAGFSLYLANDLLKAHELSTAVDGHQALSILDRTPLSTLAHRLAWQEVNAPNADVAHRWGRQTLSQFISLTPPIDLLVWISEPLMDNFSRTLRERSAAQRAGLWGSLDGLEALERAYFALMRTATELGYVRRILHLRRPDPEVSKQLEACLASIVAAIDDGARRQAAISTRRW